MDRLTFAVLSDSLAEIRRVTARCGHAEPLSVGLLRRHFSVWERGILLNAACFLLDFPRETMDIPHRAFVIAQRIVSVEFANGWVEDLVAASMGAAPWRTQFPAECLHCRRSATWRQIVEVPGGLPGEVCWRYERPENHVPLCRRCITRLVYREQSARLELIEAIWGARFEAFFRWHQSFVQNLLPRDWDRSLFPLWPDEYGGPTWETGCGGLEHSEPHTFTGVNRSPAQIARLTALLGPARAAEFVRSQKPSDCERIYPLPDVGAEQVLGAVR